MGKGLVTFRSFWVISTVSCLGLLGIILLASFGGFVRPNWLYAALGPEELSKVQWLDEPAFETFQEIYFNPQSSEELGPYIAQETDGYYYLGDYDKNLLIRVGGARQARSGRVEVSQGIADSWLASLLGWFLKDWGTAQLVENQASDEEEQVTSEEGQTSGEEEQVTSEEGQTSKSTGSTQLFLWKWVLWSGRR